MPRLKMGRRNSGSSYPEEAKDKKEYIFYESRGFKKLEIVDYYIRK